MEWYAVHAHSCREDVAIRYLARLGIETLLPRIRTTRVVRHVRRLVTVPLFPSYFFARFSVESHYRAVSYARGVRRVVAFGGVPAVVPESVIDSIARRLVDGCALVEPTRFERGQVVRIAQGPFEGIEAVFEYEMSGQQRVVLLLRTLAYSGRVVAPLDAIALP